MSTTAKKAIGLVMVLMCALGLLLSIFLIVGVWRVRQPMIDGLQVGLDHTTSLLQTTDDGLYVVDQVVSNVYSSTLYLDDATQALSKTMQSTTGFIDSAGSFVGQDLMTTITNTQTALSSAQASAAVIDNILGSIASIPFIGLNYDPGTPLNSALGEVSASLDPVQNSLKSFQTNLDNTKESMQVMSEQINSLNTKVKIINQNLSQARQTIDNYRKQVNSLKITIANAKTHISAWVTGVVSILTVVILLLVILQIAVMLQGITLLAPERSNPPPTDQNP